MSLQQIKVSREEILSIVKENKEKHDRILKDAIEGYWVEAGKYLKKYEKDNLAALDKNHKDQLKRMRKQLRDQKKAIKEQVKTELGFVQEKKKDAPWSYMRNKYPENHEDDYIGTIRRLELCVEPQVELDVLEFDKYVRNKWEWKNAFITTNSAYCNSYYNSPLTASWSQGVAISASYAITGSNTLKSF